MEAFSIMKFLNLLMG